MSEPLPPALTETSPNPFEGLGVYSTSEDLALAELQVQLQRPDLEPEGLERRVLECQLGTVMNHLGRFYSGYDKPDEVVSKALDDEREELHRTHDVHNADLNPYFIISDRANAARWKIEGIDPSTVAINERDGMQNSWKRASESELDAQLTRLKAEMDQLDANNLMTIIRTGSGMENYEVNRRQLHLQKTSLTRSALSVTAVWGSSDGRR